MNPQEILARKPLVLDQSARETYFETGYLLLPAFLDRDWLDRINEISAMFIEQSRSCKKSDEKFDVEPGHMADAPKLRRLSFPVDHHELFRELASAAFAEGKMFRFPAVRAKITHILHHA